MPERRLNVLVTAGPTREMIDRVRDWGNIFTGATGLAIADAVQAVADVVLLSSNASHVETIERRANPHYRATTFRSHADLEDLLDELIGRERFDAVFMTAAVADYRPAGTFAVIDREELENGTERWIVRRADAPKVKSTFDEIAVLGTRTRKIVDRFRRDWGYRGLLVKFKLEVGIREAELIDIGRRSREASDADFVVANTLEMTTGPNAGAFLIGRVDSEWIDRADLPARMRRLVEEMA